MTAYQPLVLPRKCPFAVMAAWKGSGFEPAVVHYSRSRGLSIEDASDRLLRTWRRTTTDIAARGMRRYTNLVVRANILKAIEVGHPHLKRDMGGVPHVALDFGAGRCSTSFVRA